MPVLPPLIDAACSGDIKKVEMLIHKKGSSIDIVDELGLTPLIWSAFHGHLDILTLLLDHGAQIDKVANNGSTALHQASFKGKTDCVKVLLKVFLFYFILF